MRVSVYSIIAAAALCLPAAVAPVFGDATTSPGKASVHASVTNALAGNPDFATLVSGSIAKGKSKQVLEVDGYLGDYQGNAADDCIQVKVNGFDDVVQAQGFFGGSALACLPCSGTFFCSIAGSWWVDLDAAEAAHPGQFIGQRLTIVLQGYSDMTDVVSASLSARLVKK